MGARSQPAASATAEVGNQRSPAAKVIARALQVYGAFIVDRFSSVISLPVESFYGKPGPNPWAGILDENDLIKLPANRFRVLKLGAQDCRVD